MGIHGQSELYSKFEASLNYMRLCVKKKDLGMVVHTYNGYNPNTWEARQEDYYKFKANLIYLAKFKPVRATKSGIIILQSISGGRLYKCNQYHCHSRNLVTSSSLITLVIFFPQIFGNRDSVRGMGQRDFKNQM